MTAEPRVVPKHVAIIMDGNGRWAKSRGLPRVAGHKRGADAVRRAVKTAGELGVRYLTLFGFSSENWKRPLDEITDLMALLRNYLRSELAELHKQGVRVRVIGDRARLAPDIVTLIEQAERTTEANTRLDFIIALSYGARAEIVRAARALAHAAKAGEIDPETIGEADIAKYLYTSDIPDPDLLVRTSGEKRISNFLLWQSAYTEFVFLDVLWPDFDRPHFEAAIAEFGKRDRRYGAIVG
jgi:undecaprenyl diphosphate synthase